MQLLIPLSKSQVSKLENMSSVNVKHGTNKQLYIVDISDPNESQRVFHALNTGKSAKLHGQHVNNVLHSGGDIKSAFKKFGNTMKKGFTQAGDKLKEGAFEVNHALKSDPTARAIVKNFVPTLTGELSGLLANGGMTVLTGNPAVGAAFGKATNAGINKGVSAALKSEGYGLKKMTRGRSLTMMEGGAITREQVEDMVPSNQHMIAKNPTVNQRIRARNSFENVANNPALAQQKAPKRGKRKVRVSVGNGLTGYGKGLTGYGK